MGAQGKRLCIPLEGVEGLNERWILHREIDRRDLLSDPSPTRRVRDLANRPLCLRSGVDHRDQIALTNARRSTRARPF